MAGVRHEFRPFAKSESTSTDYTFRRTFHITEPKHKKSRIERLLRKSLLCNYLFQVGATGFEPATSWSRIWTCPYQEIVSKVR